jgi:DNA-binding LytR/AlgR family response regulator
VITAAGSYLVNESISSLERRLAPQGFMRVHRSFLVNLDDVHDVEVSRSGLMELKVERVDASVPVSRRRASEVKARLGLA